MNIEPTAEQFLQDVAAHKMTVALNNDLYRHLLFRAPRNSNHWFEIVTWPGILTICGDMGTWTFSRNHDMFHFFRNMERSEGLKIYPHYWSEKIQNGVNGGSEHAECFDADTFKDLLCDQLENYYELKSDDLKTAKAELYEHFSYVDEDQYPMGQAAIQFEFISDGEKCRFDSWELPSGKKYEYHFIWCLYAIVWGIQQYDAAQAVNS